MSARTEPNDVFHAHLDACAHCRAQPFNLCADGQKAIEASMSTLIEHIGEPGSYAASKAHDESWRKP